ncbi:MAG: cation-translocating P-type ATPase [Eubacteriales bacterium]|nr:cation-translocating P-type ATPase [Eubacteriales bacterium]
MAEQKAVAELSKQSLLSESETYQLGLAEVIERLSVSPAEGLSQAEAERRLELYGPNELAKEEHEPLWKKFLYQFKDTMVLILIAASILSIFQGDVYASLIILAIVIVNAVLGVIQEGKAEQAIEALQQMSAPKSRVLREGQQLMLGSADLVPGDILYLEAGDIVPADLRILESSNLKAEEAALTGESLAVEKAAEFSTSEKIALGDRKNLLFSGTSLTYGRAKAVVCQTAEDTVIGHIASSLTAIEKEETPLQKNLNHLGNILGIICIAISVIVFLAGLLQGGDPLKLLMTAVSLAVAAIPEGLPAVVTIVLALGMNRMAKKHAIVKRLMAVETLGSVDTICSDKTGTLTQNEMTVQRVYADNQRFEVKGIGYAPVGEVLKENGEALATQEVESEALRALLEVCVLCNDAKLNQEGNEWSILGDPTEAALLSLAGKLGYEAGQLKEKYQLVKDLPFDSERKMMSVFYAGFQDGVRSLTKGAPDILLARCTKELVNGAERELTAARKEQILAENTALAKQALRVLAFAFKRGEDSESAESEMIFLGLAGMIDPARSEAKEAIAVCREAGIKPVMITGDYSDTAEAIAADLGMLQPGDRVIDGLALDELSDADLEAEIDQIRVFARVSPDHKLRIVKQLQAKGHTVSMTGDGVNDAPALKQADIGVAMGITGTEVSKSSAEMILTDDNFATIVSAVEEGRVIYSNIRKFVGFLLSCNVGEILVIFLTTMLLGPQFTPLLPIQLLWLNLVTDSFPALALGRERGEAYIMDRPPRDPKERIINKEMILSIAVQSIAIFVSVFAAFQLGRYFYPDVLLGANEQILEFAQSFNFWAHEGFSPSNGARTFAFVTLITAELLRAFTSRSETQSVFKLGVFSNKTMNKAVLLSFAMMLLVVFIPALDRLFYTISPNPRDWGIIIGLAFIPFVAGELFKKIYHRREA